MLCEKLFGVIHLSEAATYSRLLKTLFGIQALINASRQAGFQVIGREWRGMGKALDCQRRRIMRCR